MIPNSHAVSDLVSYEQWRTELGISSCSAWRFRKRGAIKTVTLYGRLYVSRSAIAEFERRAAAGEFAGARKSPKSFKSQTEIK